MWNKFLLNEQLKCGILSTFNIYTLVIYLSILILNTCYLSVKYNKFYYSNEFYARTIYIGWYTFVSLRPMYVVRKKLIKITFSAKLRERWKYIINNVKCVYVALFVIFCCLWICSLILLYCLRRLCALITIIRSTSMF